MDNSQRLFISIYAIFYYFALILGPQTAVLEVFSWICTQESLLTKLRRPYGVPGIEAAYRVLPVFMHYLNIQKEKEHGEFVFSKTLFSEKREK